MQILNFERNWKSESVIGTFDFTLPEIGFICRRWKVIRSKNNSIFVAGPSYLVQDEIGNKTWLNLIEVSSIQYNELKTAIFRALKSYMQQSGMDFHECFG